MKKLSVILLSLFFLVSCSKEKGEVLIRVNNTSAQNLENVVVYSFNGNSQEVGYSYGNVKQGSATSYIPQENVIDFPLLRYSVAGGSTVDIQEIRCSTGLPHLTNGRYSLLVSADTSGNLSYSYIRD